MLKTAGHLLAGLLPTDQHGRMRCGLVNCQIYTTDALGEREGGLVLIPGETSRG